MTYLSEYKQTMLYKAIARGDQKAFAEFYRSRFDRLAATVYYILKDKQQAEEVIQDAFHTIWDRRSEIELIGNVDAYLFVLAKNKSLNYLRSNVRRKQLESSFREEPREVYVEQGPSEPDYYVWVDRAVELLPPQQKNVYILSRVRRKKYLEIAEEMNISRESVKKYLRLANDSIKRYLTAHKDSIVSLFLIFSVF
ncbi:MAG TPA: sigma-70 family RNA polymerase sigma factor [Sphingobacterium sp.]|jgi:RNA polymerase sigma-70 factor (family 1)|nr:sigma-70 family RNA polymerase sigma factor [Sphingobacterium sp.]